MKFLHKKTALSVFSLSMLITISIDSVRNLPATALFGTSLIFFFLFCSLIFLLPAALVSAQLSSTFPKEGGVYYWVRTAFGEKIGFLAIWLQWINTMVWYPTILSFIAGTATFFFNPLLAQNKIYLISVILGVFWTLTFINFRGLKTSARFATFCAVFGMIIPVVSIIILSSVWVLSGKPLYLHMTSHNLIPHLNRTENWSSLTAIMTSFLGMELATVHIRNIKNGQRVFPKALFFSVLIIAATMILGSLSIALVLPKHQIHLVDGVMQAFGHFFDAYHIGWMVPILAAALLLGSLGSMVNWIISPAKGLLQAAEHGYLSQMFCKQNKHNVPIYLLIAQAILVSLVCLVFLLMPSVNGSYWLLTDLSTQLYMIMYIFMFLAAFVIRYTRTDRSKGFSVPGGKLVYSFICFLGLLACMITIIVGFFTPSAVDVGSGSYFRLVFTSGMLLMVFPVLFFYFYRNRRKK